MKKIITTALLLLFIWGCTNKEEKIQPITNNKKTGVLVVSHGSHSTKWREMVADVSVRIEDRLLSNEKISGIKNAFMEYTEPSIATRMKEFDEEGYTDVIIVPLLLTVSTHSFDDIPHIIGLKDNPTEIDKLKQENIEIYKAKANIHIAPLLDFTETLGVNLIRRIGKLSEIPENEGCVLVAYGSHDYNTEWEKLMTDMAIEISDSLGIENLEYSWCGHLVDYDTEPTTNAINKILTEKEKAIVVPVLVAFDEMFQIEIIGTAVENVKKSDRVIYKPDAILPDENIEQWIIDISNEIAKDI